MALPGFTPAAPRRRVSLSQRARRSGQRAGRRQAGRQATRVLDFLRAHGPATDQQISHALDLALASVNSVRNALVKAGRVTAVDLVPGPFGARRSRWGLRDGA
jgi:hypothetical protein